MRVKFQAGALAPMPQHQLASRTPSNSGPVAGKRFQSGLRRGAVAFAVSLALAGCASSPRQHKALPWKVEPLLDVRHGEQSSKAYYALGRYHDGSQAWDKAIDAYRKAIAADGRNAEAHNALGVLLARSQRLAEAEASLRRAIALAPDSAHIHNNLGHLLMLGGHPQQAVGELTAAVKLDPQNLVAQANLREATSRSERLQVGSTEAAPRAAATAAVAAQTPAAAAEAPAAMAQTPAAAAEAPAAPPAATPAAVAPEGPSITQSPAPVPVEPSGSIVPVVQLELSNGNGIPGAAARLKRWLAHEGMAVERLTNRRPFVQQQTTIQYRVGQRDAAQRVAEALRMTAHLDDAPVAGLQPQVRVVLGHDWVRSAACLEQRVCDRSVNVAMATAP